MRMRVLWLVPVFAIACAKSPSPGDETASVAGSVSQTSALVGPRWRLVELISTKMACVEEDRMRQEARFLGALQLADRYAISGDTLTLTAAGDAVAKFEK